MAEQPTNSHNYQRFGELVYERLVSSMPFGSLSKSETELAIYSALIESEIVDQDLRAFELAMKLRCTPARANSLIFNHRLRTAAEGAESGTLSEAVKVIRDTNEAKKGNVVLNVEDRFWRESLINRLKEQEVFTDTSFNRERVVMNGRSFTKACTAIFGDESKPLLEKIKRSKKKEPAEVIQGLLDSAAKGAVTGAGKVIGSSITMTVAALIKTL